MKINWKARFKNKAFLISFIALLVGFVYQILGFFGIIPPVSEDNIVSAFTFVLNILGMLGVVVDPTTPGTKDSDRAMTYYKDTDESALTE